MRKMIFCLLAVLTAWPVLADEKIDEERPEKKIEFLHLWGDYHLSYFDDVISNKEFEIRFGSLEPRLDKNKKMQTFRKFLAISHERVRGLEYYDDKGIRTLGYYDFIWFKEYFVYKPGKKIQPYLSCQIGIAFIDYEYQYKSESEDNTFRTYSYDRRSGLNIGVGGGFNYYPKRKVVLSAGYTLALNGGRIQLGGGLVF